MIRFNPENERIKRQYFEWEMEANGKSAKTVDNMRNSIYAFEEFTKFKSLKRLNKDDIIVFKKHIAKQKNKRTGELVSKSYLFHTSKNLIGFFRWLCCQRGYKKSISPSNINYFNLSDKDVQIAHSPKNKRFPTLSQIKRVIMNMPSETEIEKRDRALVAFLIITGMRVNAVTSLKLKHVFLEEGYVVQDPNEVKTKFGKKITSYFLPVGDEIIKIFMDWVKFLKDEKLCDYECPLFPKTSLALDENSQFKRDFLDTTPWETTSPIRKIVQQAFISAGLAYYNPHSFRNTLVKRAYELCRTPEEFKTWSQNLGHNNPLTTFTSYGHIEEFNQGEIIKRLGRRAAEAVGE